MVSFGHQRWFTNVEMNLGAMYDFGLGVPERRRSPKVYRKAVEHGVAAEYNIGDMYARARAYPRRDRSAGLV